MYEQNASHLVKHSDLGAKRKQNLSKNCSNLPEKHSENATDMKTFFKGLFTPFLGLTFLCLVNIQPNNLIQNFTSPTKIFWIRS